MKQSKKLYGVGQKPSKTARGGKLGTTYAKNKKEAIKKAQLFPMYDYSAGKPTAWLIKQLEKK